MIGQLNKVPERSATYLRRDTEGVASMLPNPITRVCRIEGCDRVPQKDQGRCSMHIKRMRAHGSYDPPHGARNVTITERIDLQVNKDGPLPEARPELGPCWLWTGSLNNKGYPLVTYQGKQRYAHRVMYVLHVGPIPDGLELDHLCQRPACIRPTHLEAVTHAINVQRGRASGLRTHCQRGHEYGVANFVVDRRGNRWCSICRAVRMDKFNARRREARRAQR